MTMSCAGPSPLHGHAHFAVAMVREQHGGGIAARAIFLLEAAVNVGVAVQCVAAPQSFLLQFAPPAAPSTGGNNHNTNEVPGQGIPGAGEATGPVEGGPSEQQQAACRERGAPTPLERLALALVCWYGVLLIVLAYGSLRAIASYNDPGGGTLRWGGPHCEGAGWGAWSGACGTWHHASCQGLALCCCRGQQAGAPTASRGQLPAMARLA